MTQKVLGEVISLNISYLANWIDFFWESGFTIYKSFVHMWKKKRNIITSKSRILDMLKFSGYEKKEDFADVGIIV